MSRIGKTPVIIPKGVEAKVANGMVHIKGPKGSLDLRFGDHVQVQHEDGKLRVIRPDDDKQSKAYHGLYKRLIANMVTGVTQGYQKELEIQGVGYRAAVEGSKLSLWLGFSHTIIFPVPKGITIEVPKPTSIIIKGIDKQAVGEVAATIRKFRPPEPYKGKGIRYVGEHVRRKVGKTGVK
ncbi:MAG: 50S ribosomal protein L6 [bacterium]